MDVFLYAMARRYNYQVCSTGQKISHYKCDSVMLRWHLSDLLQLTSHYSITHHITALHRPLVTSLHCFTVCTLSSNCHITRMPGMHFPRLPCVHWSLLPDPRVCKNQDPGPAPWSAAEWGWHLWVKPVMQIIQTRNRSQAQGPIPGLIFII